MQILRPEQYHTECAMALDDLRLNCQIKEIGQIMSTAIWLEDCGIAETLCSNGLICLPTHEYNTIVKHCKHCYFKSIQYLFSLHTEYLFRFGKSHKTLFRFETYMSKGDLFEKYEQKPFINHTTNFGHIDNVQEAYQQCLIEKWSAGSPKWTKRQRPGWAA